MSRCSFRTWAVVFFLVQALANWPHAAQAQQGDLTDFLFFVERLPASDEFTIALKSTGDPPQVTIAIPNGHRRSYFVEIGRTFFDGGRFLPIKFEKKETANADGTKTDVSELTVHDNLRRNQIVLVKDVPQHLTTAPEAILEWRRNTTEAVTVGEGADFRMPGGSQAPYRLIKVQEDSATVVPILPDGSPGKEIIIKKQSARAHRSG
jgi:hypothetical protein